MMRFTSMFGEMTDSSEYMKQNTYEIKLKTSQLISARGRMTGPLWGGGACYFASWSGEEFYSVLIFVKIRWAIYLSSVCFPVNSLKTKLFKKQFFGTRPSDNIKKKLTGKCQACWCIHKRRSWETCGFWAIWGSIVSLSQKRKELTWRL